MIGTGQSKQVRVFAGVLFALLLSSPAHAFCFFCPYYIVRVHHHHHHRSHSSVHSHPNSNTKSNTKAEVEPHVERQPTESVCRDILRQVDSVPYKVFTGELEQLRKVKPKDAARVDFCVAKRKEEW